MLKRDCVGAGQEEACRKAERSVAHMAGNGDLLSGKAVPAGQQIIQSPGGAYWQPVNPVRPMNAQRSQMLSLHGNKNRKCIS